MPSMKVMADSQLAVLPKPGSKQQTPAAAYSPRTSTKRPPAASVSIGSRIVSPPGSVSVAVAGPCSPGAAIADWRDVLVPVASTGGQRCANPAAYLPYIVLLLRATNRQQARFPQ